MAEKVDLENEKVVAHVEKQVAKALKDRHKEIGSVIKDKLAEIKGDEEMDKAMKKTVTAAIKELESDIKGLL